VRSNRVWTQSSIVRWRSSSPTVACSLPSSEASRAARVRRYPPLEIELPSERVGSHVKAHARPSLRTPPNQPPSVHPAHDDRPEGVCLNDGCRQESRVTPETAVRFTCRCPSHDLHHAFGTRTGPNLAQSRQDSPASAGKRPASGARVRSARKRIATSVESHIAAGSERRIADVVCARGRSPSNDFELPAADEEDCSCPATFPRA